MENSEIRFETDVTYDSPTLNEVNRTYPLLLGRTIISHSIVIACCLFLIVNTLIGNDIYGIYSKGFLYLAGIYWAFILVMYLMNRNGGIQYKRMLSNNNGQPPHVIVSFDMEGIHGLNLNTQSRNTFRYDQVRSVAQTKRFLILMLEYNQYLPISKEKLIGGTQDAFIDYLIANCPKIKPKKLRSSLPGQIVNGLSITVWIIGILICLYQQPFVQNFLESKRAINNTMSYQEIAQELDHFGFKVDDAMIEELDAFYSSYQKDEDLMLFYQDVDKVTDLLCYAGYGSYDPETWEWTPAASGVYWFDLEVWNLETMYTDFLRGVSALNSEDLNFTNICEDLTDVNWETGTGTQRVSFDWHGKSYLLEGQVKYDWFDMQVADELNSIIRSHSSAKQLTSHTMVGKAALYSIAPISGHRSFPEQPALS